MVVVFKYTMSCFLLATCSLAFSSEKITNFSEDALDISKINFKQALAENNKAIELCDKNKKAVPASLINTLGLPIDKIGSALLVLNERAERVCYKGSDARFLYAASAYRQTAKHYKVVSREADYYSEELMFSHHWAKLEAEAKYLSIDKKIRAKLEAIEALQVPFLFIDTMDLLKESLQK